MARTAKQPTPAPGSTVVYRADVWVSARCRDCPPAGPAECQTPDPSNCHMDDPTVGTYQTLDRAIRAATKAANARKDSTGAASVYAVPVDALGAYDPWRDDEQVWSL